MGACGNGAASAQFCDRGTSQVLVGSIQQLESADPPILLTRLTAPDSLNRSEQACVSAQLAGDLRRSAACSD